MNLKEHYESYKKSVSAGTLENSTEYARITATLNPAVYPTIYDYIRQVADGIATSLFVSNRRHYMEYLEKHQQAMLALFLKMSREMLVELGHNPDAMKPELLAMYGKEFGQKWVEALDGSVREEPRNGDLVVDWRARLF